MDYVWLVVVGALAAFITAFGIGANDVANAFATSVGSKALTLRKACVIAAFMEFFGAFLMGSHVTDTIRGKILSTNEFKNEPYVLMLAMVCVDIASGIWLIIATWLKAPVSTTHSTVGAVIGVGLAAKGSAAVNWEEVYRIFISWATSPGISAGLTIAIYLCLKYGVMLRSNPVGKIIFILPFLAAVTIFINAFFIIYKGTPALKLDNTPVSTAIGVSVALGVVAGILVRVFAVPYFRRRAAAFHATQPAPTPRDPAALSTDVNGNGSPLAGDTAASVDANMEPEVVTVGVDGHEDNVEGQKKLPFTDGGDVPLPEKRMDSSAFPMPSFVPSHAYHDEAIAGGVDVPSSVTEEEFDAPAKLQVDSTGCEGWTGKIRYAGRYVWAWLSVDTMKGTKRDPNKGKTPRAKRIIHLHNQIADLKAAETEEKLSGLHENATAYDPAAEQVVSALQVVTACFDSFAHGANDVANAVGPFAAVYTIYETGKASSKSDVPLWILAMGGIGIVIGLFVWGYRIIARLGGEVTKITPVRGFSIEIGAATAVILASRLGLPVSTTHCQVGSTVGCGIIDGYKNVDFKLVVGIVLSWVLTLPITGLIAAGIFSFAQYSP